MLTLIRPLLAIVDALEEYVRNVTEVSGVNLYSPATFTALREAVEVNPYAALGQVLGLSEAVRIAVGHLSRGQVGHEDPAPELVAQARQVLENCRRQTVDDLENDEPARFGTLLDVALAFGDVEVIQNLLNV